MTLLQRWLHRSFFIRLFHWEYWSFNAVYVPIYPVWFFLCLKARSFFFFAAANPKIRNGGFLNESKKDIAPLIPAAWHPASLFISLPANGPIVVKQLRDRKLSYPLIGKPDIGGRGRGVKVLKDDEAVMQYVSTACLDFHIQEFVGYRNEVGIFYYRIPGQDRGRISGIVRKEFLCVTGDGKSSLQELLQKKARALVYWNHLKEMQKEHWEDIIPEGERRIVSHYGNHARGARFLDDSRLIDSPLEEQIDHICKQIPEFYFGRLDIRFDNWDALKQGKQFVIIEVNGAGSEPTHIYDPSHSLFYAWKEIIRHWNLLYKISVLNHKKGAPYLSMKEGIAMFREDKFWSQKLAAMPE